MKVVVGIQARLGSTRLPGKVLMPLVGATMLERVLAACGDAYQKVVLIPDSPMDDDLAWFLSQRRIPFLRGPEENVLARYMALLDAYAPDRMIRVCADAPFIRREWVEEFGEMTDPVFVSSVLHAGGQEIWRLCNLSLGGADEHAGHDWFEKNARRFARAPADYLMVNTAEDLAEARRRFVTK